MTLVHQALMAGQTDLAINVLIPTLRKTVQKLIVICLVITMAKVRRWYTTFLRLSAIPKNSAVVTRLNKRIDICAMLSTIQVPTAVIQRNGGRYDMHTEEARYLASHIPHVNPIELPGRHHIPWWGDQKPLIAKINKLLTGNQPVTSSERFLLTLLMTDIVGSTEKAVRLGDQKWRHLLQQHDQIVRSNIASFDGIEVNTTGDGFKISFTSPSRAIQCAQSIHRDLAALGLSIRAGIHTGECERHGDDLSGVAVHLAARIMDTATSGETVVSSTVKDLVVGSRTIFSSFGAHRLKGIQDKWVLFKVED